MLGDAGETAPSIEVACSLSSSYGKAMTDSLLPRILAFVQSLNSEVEPEAIMRRSVVAVAEAVGATQAQLVHVQGERLWSDTFWRKGVWRERKVELPLTAGPAGRVAASAEAAIVNDAAGYPAVNQDTIRGRWAADSVARLPGNRAERRRDGR